MFKLKFTGNQTVTLQKGCHVVPVAPACDLVFDSHLIVTLYFVVVVKTIYKVFITGSRRNGSR